VFDYSDPPPSLSPERRARHERRARRVADLGEAWVTYFEPGKLHAKLAALGFAEIEDLGPAQIVSRYFPGRAGSLPDKGGHVIRATTICQHGGRAALLSRARGTAEPLWDVAERRF
jgi:O-methyltransferase involved in polyketide biosynthesis